MSQVMGGPADAEPLEAIPVGDDRNPLLVAIVAWGLLAVVLVTGAWWAWTRVLFPDGGSVVARYAKGQTSQWYESPHDQFRASYPTTPQRSTDAETVTVASRPGSGYLYSVTRQPEPISAAENYETTLNQIIGTIASDAKSEIVSQTAPSRFAELGVKDALLKHGGSYRHVWLVLATDRVYIIDAQSPNNDAAAAKRFRTDFTKLGPD